MTSEPLITNHKISIKEQGMKVGQEEGVGWKPHSPYVVFAVLNSTLVKFTAFKNS